MLSLTSFLLHLPILGCDIGVEISIHLSVTPTHNPTDNYMYHIKDTLLIAILKNDVIDLGQIVK